jgi:hypothetical protein
MQKKVVNWDESKAATLRPTAMQVKADREEVMLLFGTHHRSDTGEGVIVSKRMVLNPSVAKRLMIMLESVVAKYESTFGSLEEHGKPEGKEARNIIGLPPFRLRLTVERVTAFFDLLKDLRVRFAFERSIKFSRRALLGGRFLIGIKKGSIGEFEEKVLLICTRMNMPSALLDRFRSGLDAASVVGFGIDEGERGCIVKAYQEYRMRSAAPNETQPYLCNLGFKWDASNSARNVMTSYTRFPSLSVEEIQGRLAGFFPLNSEALGLAKNFVESASKKLKGSVYYTEASEQGSARSSFDLNMYEANLLMKQVYPLFLEISKLYSLHQGEFEKLYGPVSGHLFGHLAGGIDRNGEEFLTVYFGE